MNENKPHTTPAHGEHGSLSSYITGFILSLILTIIPYLLVTRHVLSGTLLLVIILVIALLQMFVQIFFFLHLGRGPKPLYNIVFFGATAGLIVLVVGASILIMNNLYKNMSATEMVTHIAQEENIAQVSGLETGACQGNNANHTVTINANGMSPGLITAKRCDTLTFKSSDGKNYMLMFGPHDDPITYGGNDAVSVRGDRAKIITLNEIGDFVYHDHNNQAITGTFSVQP